jgi:hypothetical protein
MSRGGDDPALRGGGESPFEPAASVISPARWERADGREDLPVACCDLNGREELVKTDLAFERFYSDPYQTSSTQAMRAKLFATFVGLDRLGGHPRQQD